MEKRKIGVLGAGQLGRMLLEAGHQLNLDVSFLDGPDAPAKQLSAKSPFIPSGQFNSASDILQFVSEQKIEILTVEIEHIDTTALSKIPNSVSIYPSIQTLWLIQNKFLQKTHFIEHGIPVAPFKEIHSDKDIIKVAQEGFGYPLMLKSKCMAYDGKGNIVIESAEQVNSLNLSSNTLSQDFYVEKWVPFMKELAVMVVRGIDGTMVTYPVVETQHKNNICHLVVAPAQVDSAIYEKAKSLAISTVASFFGPGIFGVEMFYLANGDILVNEVAPRPHNSGHYTIEACETSQFENHLRAICGFPLGSTAMKVPYAVMLNVLGDETGDWSTTLRPFHQSLSIPGAKMHLYGKKECKPGRKLGHITIVANTYAALRDRLSSLSYTLPSSPLPLVSVIMGSDSDLPIMQQAADVLRRACVPFEMTIVSAHRTPQRMVSFAQCAHTRSIRVIIAGAGGAAHLPGMVAALTPLPVIGVPIALKYLDGQDSLLSIVQMPRGVPVATVAINNAFNAGLLAVRILGSQIPLYRDWLIKYQAEQENQVMEKVAVLESENMDVLSSLT